MRTKSDLPYIELARNEELGIEVRGEEALSLASRKLDSVMSEHTIELPPVDTSVPPAEGIVRVTFQPENKTVEFPFGTLPYDGHGRPMSFLDVAENYGIFLDHACGGVCACTTCHVYVKQGEPGLSDPEDDELDRVDLAAGPQTNSRLGCQAVIEKPGTYTVEIPAWNRNYVQEGKPAAIVAGDKE